MSIENLLYLSLAAIAVWFVAVVLARSVARREIGKLRREMASRAAEAVPVPVAAAAVTAEPPPSEELDDEILAVLSATVAAFLGKTARIRRARLLGPFEPSNAWAQQGRVYVQASHNLGAR